MNGIICIDKPESFTSFDVIAKVRGIIGERKMGHAGTLDPMVTGVLPIFMGGATKAIGLLDDQTKSYRGSFRLGVITDTQDIWGSVTENRKVNVSKDEVLYTMSQFVGKIKQVPPMFSAVRVGGQRLYALARQGVEITREPRDAEIYSVRMVSADEGSGEYTFDVDCSKGTYIRTLFSDVGQALGCGAVMTSLRRTRSCGFCLEDCVTIGDLQKIRDEGGEFPVIPTQRAFAQLPEVTVSQAQARRFINGAPLDSCRVTTELRGRCAVFSPDGTFLGIGDNDGETLSVVKLFVVREDTYSHDRK